MTSNSLTEIEEQHIPSQIWRPFMDCMHQLFLDPIWIRGPTKKMYLKMSSVKWRPFCLSHNMLKWVSEGYLILQQSPGVSQWRHNGCDGVSNHQPHCLFNRLFRLRSNKKNHQSSASLAFVRGIHRWPVNSPHKWPVTLKMFPFDYVTK